MAGALNEPPEDLDVLAHAVIGAAIEVHRCLGPGFLEKLYEEASAIEFELRKIPFERQKQVVLFYKSHEIGTVIVDFMVGDTLVVELKTVEEITQVHQAQVISYLKAFKVQLGLLINFNVHILKEGIHRIVLTS